MSMIKGRRDTICLRCEARLFIYAVHARSTSTSLRPRRTCEATATQRRIQSRRRIPFDLWHPAFFRPFATRRKPSKSSTKSQRVPTSTSEPSTHDPLSSVVTPQSARNEDDLSPVTWASLLRTQTLGEATSVLILRDQERARARQLGRELDSPKAKDVPPDELLASIAGQDEVDQYINSLRPSKETLIITVDEYNTLLEKLVKSFDQEQLARYRLVNSERVISKEQGHTIGDELSEGHGSFSERTGRSEWQPFFNDRPTRGKKLKVADAIIRAVWQLRIHEEALGNGHLTLLTDHDCYRLLNVGGQDSILSRIGRQRSVEIQAFLRKERGTIRIEASKEAATEAADDIERLVMGLHKQDFSLKPFKPSRVGINLRESAVLKHFSEQSKSIIELSVDLKKLIITSISKSDADKAARLLLDSLELPSITSRRLIQTDDSATDVAVWPVRGDRKVSNVDKAPTIGRLMKFLPLSNKARDLRNPLLGQTCFDDRAIDQLRNFLLPNSEQGPEEASALQDPATSLTRVADAKTEGLPISVDFGSVLHPLKGRSYELDSLSSVPISENCRYVHDAPGLRQALYHFSETPLATARYVTILMQPSPWSTHGLRAGVVYPTIRMTFLLEEVAQSRRLHIGRIETIQDRKEAHVLLPHFPMDLRFTREKSRPIELTEEFKAFVLQVQQSLSGYGHLSVPASASFPVPRNLAHGGSLEAQLEPMEYFTTSAQLSEVIRLDLNPYELTFSRFNSIPSEGEWAESLTLKAVLPPPSAWEISPDENDQTKINADPFQHYLNKTEEIVKTITRNVGEGLRDDMRSMSQRGGPDALGDGGGSLRLTGTT